MLMKPHSLEDPQEQKVLEKSLEALLMTLWISQASGTSSWYLFNKLYQGNTI